VCNTKHLGKLVTNRINVIFGVGFNHKGTYKSSMTYLTQMKSVCKKYDPDKMVRREKVTSL